MYNVTSIGEVKSEGYSFQLEISKQFRSGLKELDKFSHIIVFWWANNHDNEEDRNISQTKLPYEDNMTAGVFACRSPYRPNPMGITVCNIIDVDEEKGIIRIGYIDAFDHTPIIDLKPYIPVSDRVKNVEVPAWFSAWPDWWEDAGEFFSKFNMDE